MTQRSQRRKRYAIPKSPNLLNQKFEALKPNEIWLADIAYVKTLDLFSKRIVGLSISNRMQTGLVKSALQQAVINRNLEIGLMHHSNRGSQYISEDFRQMRLSMNSGSCYDNAPMESFLHLKNRTIVFNWIQIKRGNQKRYF